MKSSCFTIVGLAAALTVAGSMAFAQTPPAKENKPAAPKAKPGDHPSGAKPTSANPDQHPPLPPGWTEADMQACTLAGTPGEKHALLAKSVGVWAGKCTSWMAPGMDPMYSECKSKISTVMDGRFIKLEMDGDMPGMGPFHGFGLYGYDNVSQKYQATWIDNCGTTIMPGVGEAAADGKTITWKYSYTCPITKKPVVLRNVERTTGNDTKMLEMYGIDPKGGKEFKMMEISLTRTSGAPTAAAPTSGR